MTSTNTEVPQLWGALIGGGGGASLYGRHTYFERNMDARLNIYFGRHFA
jgi:hypothetical protein